MSYQVLARKWRPKSFGTLVGQEHVVRALGHALATGRLHHAYLFTGTRGVGKTTISRILAKALNCETGVTPEPCGECPACRAIDADRFPDYVEMDAASNRGVEDMAALLDKAVYAPVQGRYKVYMIDEVHMLTGHAFNAMLKTLEEPPEHVKFILATTDPQKIPVTVLSRCLQFNLKQMSPAHIVEHLSRLLEAEGVPFDPGALRHLARAAQGSMRDALSLLDQAIAHGAGKVEEEQVSNMLGAVGDDHLHAVLAALAVQDLPGLLAIADAMALRSLSFDAALQGLASLLHRVALVQYVPEAVADPAERAQLLPHAAHFDAEYLQLAYQIAIHGRDELPLAPDDYTGFTMTLLRLHAFRPEQPPALGRGQPGGAGFGGGVRESQKQPAIVVPSPLGPVASSMPAGTATEKKQISDPVVPEQHAAPGIQTMPPVGGQTAGRETLAADQVKTAVADGDVPPWMALPPEAMEETGQNVPGNAPGLVPDNDEYPPVADMAGDVPQQRGSAPVVSREQVTALLAKGDWLNLLHQLDLGGMVRELAQHCEWGGQEGSLIRLRLSSSHRHLLEVQTAAVERLQAQLEKICGDAVQLCIEVGELEGITPAQHHEAERQVRHAAALSALTADPFVCALVERFNAKLIEQSVVVR